MAQDEDFENFILMHAMGANTAGQLGSVMAGGVLLARGYNPGGDSYAHTCPGIG
jgi:hypothetical protein